MNASVLLGLLFCYLRGTPVLILAITGFVLLTFVNLLLWSKQRKSLRQ